MTFTYTTLCDVPAHVLDIASDQRTHSAAEIVIGNTLDQAVPAQVRHLIQAVATTTPDRRNAYKCHGTRGLGIADSRVVISEPHRSETAQGARSEARAFEWVIA
ncbi:hypothetical protein [Nocardia fusca]|uniref:hypothetical protein n=1 Tax=Nocardia fusca TaxID=941183 RepID=UPI0007A73883|nr:hypothetical protein [Nocardia fusca]